MHKGTKPFKYFVALLLFVLLEIGLDFAFKDPTAVMEENSPLGIYGLYLHVAPADLQDLPMIVDLDIGLPDKGLDVEQRTCKRIGRLAGVMRSFKSKQPRVVAIDMILPDGCREVDEFLSALKDLLKDGHVKVVLATNPFTYQDEKERWRIRPRKLFPDKFHYCDDKGRCNEESSGLAFSQGVARIYADNRLLPIKFNFDGEDYASLPYRVAYEAGKLPSDLLAGTADEEGELKEFASRYYTRFAPEKGFRRFSSEQINKMVHDPRQANSSDVTELEKSVVIVGASDGDLHRIATGEVVPGYILQANYIHAFMQNGQRLWNSPWLDIGLGLLLAFLAHFAFDVWGEHESLAICVVKCLVTSLAISIAIFIVVWFVALLNVYVAPFGVYFKGVVVQSLRKCIVERAHA
jgi:hypothetical protein